jgi:serine/threonine protein kinase
LISQIPPEEQARFQQFVQRFREQWHANYAGPLVADGFQRVLPNASDPLRRPVLLDLIAIDLVTRIQRGEYVSLRDYLELNTELGEAADIPIELLRIEFRARRDSAKPLSTEEFLADYPAHATVLREYCDLLLKTQQFGATLKLNPLESSQTQIAPIPAPSDREVGTSRDSLEVSTPRSQKSTMRSSWDARSTDRFVSLEGDYRMIRKIGQGSYGEVWLSEAPGGVEVALKVVHIPAGQRIKDLEVRSLDLMKRLRHPFLLQVQAFWVLDEQILIAMELADESLRDRARLNSEGMALPELLQLMTEAAEGIDYLHRQKVVHRDIKPENLLLLKGHIKVADFGLARFMDESGLNAVATQVAGSPLYIAPEGWSAKPVPASDLYSLAVTYIELRVGRAPFASTSMVEVMKEHLYGEPDLSGLPASEQKVLRTALAKHPDDRFASCSEFVQALARATATPVEPPTASRNKQRIGVATTLLLLSVIVALGSVAYWNWRSRVAPRATTVKLRDDISLAYGEHEQLEISTDGVDAIERVEFSNLPTGVSIQFDPSSNVLDVNADLNAPLGASDVALRVTTPQGTLERDLKLSIIDSPRLRIPPRARPSVSARRAEIEGRVMYDTIEIPLPSSQAADVASLEFVLIPRRSTADPPTFYMLKQEVSNRWFAQYADTSDELKPAEAAWRQGSLAGGVHLGVAGPQVDFPVVHVTVDEAHAFAEWFGGLLPTTEQWDKAAGQKEPSPIAGPFLPGAEKICINRFDLGPMPCGTSDDDVSPLGVFDLAGSVSEFTRNILNSNLVVPVLDRINTDRVILRGNSYHDPLPWSFEEAQDSLPPSLPYDETKPEIGFRIVIELL